jgi:segregation and condensation protein A
MLLEYRRFKEASEDLRARSESWSARFPPGRAPDLPGPSPEEIPLGDVSLWDLALAFNRLMEEVGADRSSRIVYDDVPVEVHMDGILGTLAEKRRVPFRALFPEHPDRSTIAGVFLALLELIRQLRVRARQEKAFGEIEVELAPPPAESEAPTA